MECKKSRVNEKRARKWKKSFTEALKEKYCVEDEQSFDFIIVSPKRKSNSAELAHLQTVVLNEMNVTRADIPHQGLTSLCPNVVDLDLANNLLENWSELLDILSHLPRVKFVNVSLNKLRLNPADTLPDAELSVENLALNYTGVKIEEMVRLSQIMPALKELHLCGNSYAELSSVEHSIRDGAFSCLECLRLNNNEISQWSEVWKLRHLPHLKYLILSGNPVSNVFYDQDGDDVEKHGTEIPVNAQSTKEFQMSEQLTSVPESDNDAILDKADNRCNVDHLDGIDIIGDYDDHMVPDDLQNSDDEEELDVYDDGDNEDDDRPVSRFGRHTESDYSSGSDGESDGATTPEADDSLNMSTGHCDDGVSNKNFNNSHKRETNRAAFDNPDCNTFAFLGPFSDTFLDDESVNGDNNNEDTDDESEDWHRIAAEAFLYDIISSINFDEEPPGPTTFSSQPTLSHSGSAHVTVVSSHNSDVRTSDVHTETMNEAHQWHSTSALKAEEKSCANHISQSEELDDGPFLCTFLNGGADYTPRAVMMFDELDLTPVQSTSDSAVLASHTQDQRFPQSNLNTNNNNGMLEGTDFTSDTCKPESDTCTGCETEQQRSPHGVSNEESNASSRDMVRLDNSSSLHSCVQSSKLNKTDNSTMSQNAISGTLAGGHDNNQLADKKDGTSNTDTTLLHCRPHDNKTLFGVQNKCDTDHHQDKHHHNHQHHHHHHHHHPVSTDTAQEKAAEPFQHLQMLCLSSANLNHWTHLKAFSLFPKLTNLRLKNNPLYSSVNSDDRRKLYIASLPEVSVLNGSEVSSMERDKAENFYLRHFMDKEEKPEFYHSLVKKHGPPVKLVDIDLRAGYQEWADLKFLCKGVEKFTRKIHLVEPVGKLRILISQTLGLPQRCFVMYHHSCGPSHPEYERELIELRCESLPMSRFDFADGDEIHVDVRDYYLKDNFMS